MNTLHDIPLPIYRHVAKRRGLKFYCTGKPCKHGHEPLRYTATGNCVACAMTRTKEYVADNRDEHNRKMREYMRLNRHKHILEKDELRKNDLAAYLLLGLETKAKRRGLECSLTKDDLIVPECCPVFGTKWDWSNKDTVPSLDRVDNSKGYVAGNVKVISYKANRLKSDAMISDIEKVLDYMKNNT